MVDMEAVVDDGLQNLLFAKSDVVFDAAAAYTALEESNTIQSRTMLKFCADMKSVFEHIEEAAFAYSKFNCARNEIVRATDDVVVDVDSIVACQIEPLGKQVGLALMKAGKILINLHRETAVMQSDDLDQLSYLEVEINERVRIRNEVCSGVFTQEWSHLCDVVDFRRARGLISGRDSEDSEAVEGTEGTEDEQMLMELRRVLAHVCTPPDGATGEELWNVEEDEIVRVPRENEILPVEKLNIGVIYSTLCDAKNFFQVAEQYVRKACECLMECCSFVDELHVIASLMRRLLRRIDSDISISRSGDGWDSERSCRTEGIREKLINSVNQLASQIDSRDLNKYFRAVPIEGGDSIFEPTEHTGGHMLAGNKYQGVLEAEASCAELHQMYLDFALLTEKQGELLDQLEFKCKDASDHLDLANESYFELWKRESELAALLDYSLGHVLEVNLSPYDAACMATAAVLLHDLDRARHCAQLWPKSVDFIMGEVLTQGAVLYPFVQSELDVLETALVRKIECPAQNLISAVEIVESLLKEFPQHLAANPEYPSMLEPCRLGDLQRIRYLLHFYLRFPALTCGSYCAVGAALLNDTAKTLQCLRLWPQHAHEIIRERNLTVVPGRKTGLLRAIVLRERAKPGARAQKNLPSLAAIDAAMAVATALKSSGALSVINVHICGEGYAGKTMTKQALLKTLNAYGAFYFSTLQDIAGDTGRTLGMVSESIDLSSSVRMILHDYGGQQEFRANHAAHLSAPNSVYVLVVPLWDKRPGLESAITLEAVVAKYTEWLKFIYAVVAKGGGSTSSADEQIAPMCITCVNFAAIFSSKPRPYTVEEAVRALLAVQKSFNKDGVSRLSFLEKPIVLDAINPRDVYRSLAPALKRAAERLSSQPTPVISCLQTLLQDKQSWPIFSNEKELAALIETSVAKHGDFQADVLQTLRHIVQNMLVSRRDIIVFPYQNGDILSINHPNWLTNKVLGSLFSQAALPCKKSTSGKEKSHLLSMEDINKAVSMNLDASCQVMLEQQCIPKLLEHVGVCIPVVLGSDGYLTGVANSTNVTHWFPALSTVCMADADATVLPGADYLIARRFDLLDPEFCIFPHGYFSSLFVSVVSLYNKTNLIQIYKDGMNLRSGSHTFQIIVRHHVELSCFVVIVATKGMVDKDIAFKTVQQIKQFIFSASEWRGNVQVQELGLHPIELLSAVAISVDVLETRMLDDNLRLENQSFYFGLQRSSAGDYVPHILSEVLQNLQALNVKIDYMLQLLAGFKKEFTEAITDIGSQLFQLGSISTTADSILEVVEHFDIKLAKARDSPPVASVDELKALLNALHEDFSAALDAQAPTEQAEGSALTAGDVQKVIAEAFGVLLTDFVEATTNASAQAPSAVTSQQLQDLKLGVLAELSTGMQDLSAGIVTANERIQSLVAQLSTQQQLVSSAQPPSEAKIRSLIQQEFRALSVNSRTTESSEKTTSASLMQKLVESEATQSLLYEEVLRLQESVRAVHTVQQDSLFGVHDMPLLIALSQPDATGLRGVLQRTCFDIYSVHFVCPVCGSRASSAAHPHGYKLKVSKEWMRRMTKVLKVTLLAAQVISLATPVPLPHLSKLAEYLPAGIAASDLKDVLGKVLDVVNAQNTSKLNLPVAPTVGDALPPRPPAAVDVSLEYVTSIKAVLQMVKESSPPQHTGLRRAICTSKGQCAWVCDTAVNCGAGVGKTCYERFVETGNECMSVCIRFK